MTDWKKEFKSLYPVNEQLSEFDPGGWAWWKEVQPEIIAFITKLLADERKKVLEEVRIELDIIQKACTESDGLIDGVTALHELRAKLAQLKGDI